MSERKRSQRGFVAVTLITVLAIALVLVVYAALLGTFTGGEVTVGGITASVSYSTTNSTTNSDYKANLYNLSISTDSMFSKINITNPGYAGPVSITWKLQNNTLGTWANVTGATTVTTSIDLDGTAGQNIYASSDGSTTGAQDWMTDISGGPGNGAYRVKVWIESTG